MEKNCYNIKHLEKYLNKPFIYVRKSENNEQIFKFDDIAQEVTKCIELFQQNLVENQVGIALDIQEHSAASCIFLLGILNHNCHFFCLDFKGTKDIENHLRLSGVNYVISKEIPSTELTYIENSYEIKIFDEIFHMTKVKNFNESFSNLRLCYTIATSGSTGLPKMVHVPFKCIEANIKSLSLLLKLYENDIIFLGSPPTFDPFVVELFLALENGAAVLITSSEIRLKPQYLLKILFPCNSNFKGITILQTTPSLFRLFGSQDIQNKILSPCSSLRCLILGGEEFPYRTEFQSWLPSQLPSSGKRIFNIYGITEVSCWSTIYEFDSNKNSDYNPIPLGTPLDSHTFLRIVDQDGNVVPNNCAQGELLIGSSIRRCFITGCDQSLKTLESSDLIYRKTGDIVECDKFGNIFFIGRINNTIKRLGKRLCLDSLSKKLENLLNTKNVSSKVVCLWHKESTKLIFYINSHNTTPKQKETNLHLFKKNLEKHEQPDEIYYNNEMPLNHNDKIDREKLMDTILTIRHYQKKTALEIFKDFLETVMGIRNETKIKLEHATNQANSRKRIKYDLNISFINAGGTSFQALSLATAIAGTMESLQEQRKILELLLDGNKTINDILEFLSSATNKTKEITFEKPTNLSHSFELLWRYDFKKCIDATPTIYQEKFITVGSHSHLLLSLDANSGNIVSRLELPDRIECSVVFVLSDLALVGCYDGFLYGFNFHSGSVVFKINVKGMIKAKPLVIKNTIIVGSYAEKFNVMAFDIKSLDCLWRIKLGSKGIFSSPLKVSEESVLVCSLDGSYALIKVNTGCFKWLQKLESPIFSTPTKTESSETSLVIAEVKGQILVCNEGNGEKVSSYQADGNIFSGLTIHQHTPNTTFIIFGCHDKNLYCLNFENTTKRLTLSCKFLSNSAIYSTPILICSNYILTCSTKGLIMLLDVEKSGIKASYDLKAEVFSTPCCLSDKYVYVGARDNFLYAFKLE